MKRFLTLGLAFTLLALGGARAQGPDDEYVQIYSLIQDADALNSAGALSPARAKYLEAQTALERFQKLYPDWNPRIFDFRLAYVKDKLAGLSARLPAQPAPLSAATNQAPGALAPATAGKPAVPPQPQEVLDLRNQLSALQSQVQFLQADRQLLEAKLKEALSVQPAAVDPRELARAQAQLKALEKENDLLKVGLEQQKAKATPGAADPKALAEAQQALTEANRQLVEQTQKANALAQEKKHLEAKLAQVTPSQEKAGALESTRLALAEATRQLAAQKELAAKLTAEKDALQARLKNASPESDTLAALRAENALLKKQAAETKAASASGSKASLGKQLAAVRAELAALESERDVLRVEKLALENRLKQRAASAVATNAPAARVAELESQLAGLKARVEVFEARAVPFTAQELAAFNKPVPQPVALAAEPAAQPAPPPSAQTITLVRQAQRYFANRQLDKAEGTYLQVLHQEQTNVVALANLATIQMANNHLAAAETNILQALVLAPDDAYSLSILGYLRYRQHQYDAALDALGRAAQRDPQNAQVQNYLGITLAEKGLRGPAETAFRKALQLEPNYGDAHVNLALVYVAQQPPALELARWHYQRALTAGHPREAYLDQALEVKK